MDSGNESETSSIKLRKYAKRGILGQLKMADGSVRDIPTSTDVQEQLMKVAKHLEIFEKAFNNDSTDAIRRGFKLMLDNLTGEIE